jgi:hypothetical protein
MNVRVLALLLMLGSVGCGNLLAPDGRWVPRDPGTLVVQVRDQGGDPIGGARVSVEFPNDVGSTFFVSQETNSTGAMTMTDVPAGNRRVLVDAPAGLRADVTQLARDVVVVEARPSPSTSCSRGSTDVSDHHKAHDRNAAEIPATHGQLPLGR